MDIDFKNGVPLIKAYGEIFKLTLPEFIDKFNANLNYWIGDKWEMQINPDILITDDPVLINVSNAPLWDVLQQVYELYNVRWRIEFNGNKSIIKLGYPEDEIQHIFEYEGHSDNGGLSSVERISGNDKIVTVLMGRGGERNVPERYFQNAGDNFPKDPDQNTYTASLNIKQLMPKCFRDYNRGWNDKNSPKKTDQSDAYYVGYEDIKYRPIEWVKSKEISIRGEVWDTLAPNEEIYPTIQNVTGEQARAAGVTTTTNGRLDTIIAVEAITGSDNPDDKLETIIGIISNMDPIIVSPKDPSSVVRESNIFKIENPNNKVTFNLSILVTDYSGEPIPDPNVKHIVISNTIYLVNVKTNDIIPIDSSAVGTFNNVPIGEWQIKTNIKTVNEYKYVIKVIPKFINTTITTINKLGYKPTFDIWIPDIGFDLRDAEYWASSDMTVIFSTGWLSGSEEYEFKIRGDKNAQGVYTKIYVEPDSSKMYKGINSAWRISLIKSDAEFNTIGAMLPNKDLAHQAVQGDHFFFVNINLPHSYVKIAENRIEEWIKASLNSIDKEYPTYSIKADKLLVANFAESEKLKTGSILRVYNKNLIGDVYTNLHIQNLTLKIDVKNLNCDWELTVSDKVSAVLNSVQLISAQVQEMSQNQITEINVASKITAIGDRRWLRKDGISEISASPTNFFKEIKAEQGIISKNIISPNFIPSLSGGFGYGIFFNEKTKRYEFIIDDIRARNSFETLDMLYRQLLISGEELIVSNGGVLTDVSISNTRFLTTSEYPNAAILTQNGKAIMLNNPNSTKIVFKIKGDDGVDLRQFRIGDILKYSFRSKNILKNGFIIISNILSNFIFEGDLVDGSIIPVDGMSVAQIGSTIDKERQGFVTISSRDRGVGIYDEVNNAAIARSNLKGWFGYLGNIVDSLLGRLSGYGIYTQNFYGWGELVIKSTGEKVSTSLSVLKDAIISKANKIIKDKNGKDIDLESTVLQTAEGITQTVKKGEIVSEINQSSETIKISAQKIRLEGYVSINKNFEILGNGNMKAVNANISGSIFATKGEIGGFDISSNRIGVPFLEGGTNRDGLSLYNYLIKFKEGNRLVLLGDNVVSQTSGQHLLGIIRNVESNPWGTNQCLAISAENALYNTAINYKGSIIGTGAIMDYSYRQITPAANGITIIDYHTETILINFINQSSGVTLPKRSQIQAFLGITANTLFSISITLICSNRSSVTGLIYGRNNNVSGQSSGDFPLKLDNNGNASYGALNFAKGDTASFRLVFDGATYVAYYMNYRT
ncbi:MAG: hypothetical protein RR513_09530 [Muribaculaceae bacterium]